MKNIYIYLMVIGLVLFLHTNNYAQGSFGFSVGTAIPISDFGDSDIDSETAGAAATGINLGLNYKYDIFQGVGAYASIDFSFHQLKKKFRNDWDDYMESEGIYFADYTFPNYFNFPISAGILYKTQGNGPLNLYVLGGLTYNILKTTDFKIEIEQYYITESHNISTNFGYKLGAGIYLGKVTTISFHYLALGTHKFDGKITSNFVPNMEDELKQKIDLFTVTLGFNF